MCMLFTYCNKSRCLDVLCKKVLQLLTALKFHVKSVCVNCKFSEQWIIHNVETVKGIC